MLLHGLDELSRQHKEGFTIDTNEHQLEQVQLPTQIITVREIKTYTAHKHIRKFKLSRHGYTLKITEHRTSFFEMFT